MIQRFMCVAKVIAAVLCLCGTVLGCRSSSRSVVAQPGSMGGDMDSHGCRASAGYVWSEVWQDCIRVFECGVRTEAVDGNSGAAYLVFSTDSSRVELFFSNGDSNETLERRVLPSGAVVWNVEDDDTKNVRRIDGLWIVERRGRLVYRESAFVADEDLGRMQERIYEGGLPGSDCSMLVIRNREHSGDGTFLWERRIYSSGVEEEVSVCSGRLFTLRGSADDENAVVWQLVADDGLVFNFCLSDSGQQLVALNARFERLEDGTSFQLVEQKEL